MKLHLKFHGFRWKTFIAILLPTQRSIEIAERQGRMFSCDCHAILLFLSPLSVRFSQANFSPLPFFSTRLSSFTCVHEFSWWEMCWQIFHRIGETVGKSRLKSFKGRIVRLSISPFSIVSQSLVKICYHAQIMDSKNLYFYSNRNRREKIRIPRWKAINR